MPVGRGERRCTAGIPGALIDCLWQLEKIRKKALIGRYGVDKKIQRRFIEIHNDLIPNCREKFHAGQRLFWKRGWKAAGAARSDCAY